METFQQLKTTFTPFEKLEVLVETFKEINKIGQEAGGSDFCWSMDNLFPVFVYIGLDFVKKNLSFLLQEELNNFKSLSYV